jgi:acyl-CoA thioester hydrolase
LLSKSRLVPAIFEFALTVESRQIDGLGHASNIAYLEWMQAAAVSHSAAQGWPAERYRQLGFGWVVQSHKIEYRQAALAGQAVVVRTWVATMRRASSLRRYEIRRQEDGALLAVAETNWAFVNYATGAPAKIPPELAQSFVVVPDEAARG